MATFPPNVKYVERFQEVQMKARETNRGLWGLSEGQLCQQTDRSNGIGGGCDAGWGSEQERPSPSGPSDAGGGGGDLVCSDFSTQEEAQEVLNQDPGDPNRLDGEGYRVRCMVCQKTGPTRKTPEAARKALLVLGVQDSRLWQQGK